MRLSIVLSLFFILFSQSAFAELFANFQKSVVEKAINNAYNMSDENSTDKKIYAKILRGHFKNPIESARLKESDLKEVLHFRSIKVGNERILIFKTKPITGRLFIANHDGKIIFSADEWAEEFDVIENFQYHDWFVVTKVVYNAFNHNEIVTKYHVFERKVDGSIENILSFMHSFKNCIHNDLLPTDVKKEVEEAKKFYTACYAKAKFVPSKTGKPTKYEFNILFNYQLKQDFLTAEQYKKLLDYYFFPTSGKKAAKWVFRRDKDFEKFRIDKGNESDPLDATDLSIENY